MNDKSGFHTAGSNDDIDTSFLEETKKDFEVNETEAEKEIRMLIDSNRFLMDCLDLALGSYENKLPVRANDYVSSMAENDESIQTGLRILEQQGGNTRTLLNRAIQNKKLIERSIIKVIADRREVFYQFVEQAEENNRVEFFWNLVDAQFRNEGNPLASLLETELRCLAKQAESK